jgi:hypothetical protein
MYQQIILDKPFLRVLNVPTLNQEVAMTSKQPQRVKVTLGRKRYVVVRDAGCVLYITYSNSVMGDVALDMTGRVAKKVLAKLHAEEMRSACPREINGCVPGY